MASPISVGDALALAKLALVLGRAFSKGRASAPAEFREVESQLYSLSAALDALTSMIPDATAQEAGLHTQIFQSTAETRKADDGDYDSISHAIRSCQATVRHLESIVSNYAVLRKKRDEKPAMARFKRWNDNLSFTWKSIKWTTEGGDLMALRSHLTVHTNSLNLFLGIKLK